MSQKILETTERVQEQMNVPEDVYTFVQNIISFECFEKTYQFKKRYKEELAKVSSGKEA